MNRRVRAKSREKWWENEVRLGKWTQGSVMRQKEAKDMKRKELGTGEEK